MVENKAEEAPADGQPAAGANTGPRVGARAGPPPPGGPPPGAHARPPPLPGAFGSPEKRALHAVVGDIEDIRDNIKILRTGQEMLNARLSQQEQGPAAVVGGGLERGPPGVGQGGGGAAVGQGGAAVGQVQNRDAPPVQEEILRVNFMRNLDRVENVWEEWAISSTMTLGNRPLRCFHKKSGYKIETWAKWCEAERLQWNRNKCNVFHMIAHVLGINTEALLKIEPTSREGITFFPQHILEAVETVQKFQDIVTEEGENYSVLAFCKKWRTNYSKIQGFDIRVFVNRHRAVV